MMGNKKQKLWIGKSNVAILVSVSIVVIKQYNHKQHGEEKVYFAYSITAHHWMKSGWELVEGSWKQELNNL